MIISLAWLKESKVWQPLTSWVVKDIHPQQAWNITRHGSHSLPEKPRIGIISRLDTQESMAATHFLENQRQASSANFKHSKEQLSTADTHFLKNQEHLWSAGLKYSKPWQPLTGWSNKDSHHHHVWNSVRHSCHTPTGEPRTGMVKRVGIQQGKAATHFLESQVQALSAGLKCDDPRQALTFWKAKIGIVNRVKMQDGTVATHKLISRVPVWSSSSTCKVWLKVGTYPLTIGQHHALWEMYHKWRLCGHLPRYMEMK